MRLLKILPILLIIAVLQYCNEKGTEPEKTGSISGTVFKSGTSEPISGAIVTCAGRNTTTNNIGNYKLLNVPVGQQTLKADKTDFEEYLLTISVNEGSNEFNIYMSSSIATTTISGKVSDFDNGNSIQGTEVTLAGLTDYTDFTGNYQIPNVPQGQQTIDVIHSTYHSFSGSVYLGPAPKEINIILYYGPPQVNNVNGTSTASCNIYGLWSWSFTVYADVFDHKTISSVIAKERFSGDKWSMSHISGKTYKVDKSGNSYWGYSKPDSVVAIDIDGFRTAVKINY